MLRRIYRAPELLQLLATFGVVLMLQDITLLVWGPNDLSLARAPWLRSFVRSGRANSILRPGADRGRAADAAGVVAAVHRTRWGTLVRAATQDRDMVAALGVDQRVLFSSVFTLGAALAGMGGALALPDARRICRSI